MARLTAVDKHAGAMYTILSKNAKPETLKNPTDGADVEVPVYRGHITRLWNELGISNSYYSRVMRNLEELGCIMILQRGAANTESVVAVLRAPERGEIRPPGDLTRTREDATLRAELENVLRNIGGIDFKEAFKDIESRLSALEGKVRQNGKNS